MFLGEYVVSYNKRKFIIVYDRSLDYEIVKIDVV
jgi:hypothetical protein